MNISTLRSARLDNHRDFVGYSHAAADMPRAPYRWDEARRALLRAELNAWFARAYGLTRDELRYILGPACEWVSALRAFIRRWANGLKPELQTRLG